MQPYSANSSTKRLIPPTHNFRYLCVAGILFSNLSGCSDYANMDVGEQQSPGVIDQELYRVRDAWPGGTVPLCWTIESQEQANFAKWSTLTRLIVERHFSTAANIEFTWAPCPPNTTGMVPVSLTDDTSSSVTYAPTTLNLESNPGLRDGLTTSEQVFEMVVLHEVAHLLGFAHEFNRPGFINPTNIPNCTGSNPISGGDTVGTASDYRSVTASTYNCNNNTELSAWDVVGLQRTYGPRTQAALPLVVGYKSSQNDGDYYIGTDPLPSNYTPTFTAGWVFKRQLTGTKKLRVFRNNARNDYFITATPEGVNSAVGYTELSSLGYVYENPQVGTIPLEQYWHAGRQDNALVAGKEAKDAVVAAGYTRVRTEGHVPEKIPYTLAWRYWHAGRADNLVASGESPLRQAALDAGYASVGFDGAYWRYNYPGTQLVNNHWNGTYGDHGAAANQETSALMISMGYTKLQGPGGYLQTSQLTDGVEMRAYLHGARHDFFTTMNYGQVALDQGYSKVNHIEGYGLPVIP